MNGPLDLIAVVPDSEIPPGEPVWVEVRLRNRSAQAHWVNGRLGVGYQDGLLRELYFEVRDERDVLLACPDEARVDVHRQPPAAHDFVLLAPGAEVATTVAADLWFPFLRPGRYRLTFVYENSWSGADQGVAVFTGLLRARPVEVALR